MIGELWFLGNPLIEADRVEASGGDGDKGAIMLIPGSFHCDI